MIVKVKKLSPDATLPSYAHPGDAGMDMYSNETVTVLPGETIKIHTGVSMEIPEGYVGLVWDKSGISANHKMKVLGGVVDSSYRGEVMCVFINLGSDSYTFEKGHKAAQMLIQKVESVELVEGNLGDTTRGDGGFGSTGK